MKVNKISVMKKVFLLIVSFVLMLITGCNHTENNGFCGYYLGDSYSELRRQLKDEGVSYDEDYVDDSETVQFLEFKSKYKDKINRVEIRHVAGRDEISMISTELYSTSDDNSEYYLGYKYSNYKEREKLRKVLDEKNLETLRKIFHECSKWELDVTNSHYSSPDNYLAHFKEAEYPVIFTYNRNSSGTLKFMIIVDCSSLWKDNLSAIAILVNWKQMQPYIKISP